MYKLCKCVKKEIKVDALKSNLSIIDKSNVIHSRSIKNTNSEKFHNPELGLWKAVIMQAVLDSMSNSKRSSEVLAKKMAIDWLNIKNSNFIKVCNYAGLDPNWVLKKITFAINNPRMWRRECDLKNFFK